MLCPTPDPRLAYFSRGRNYVRSHSAELLEALNQSIDIRERLRVHQDLEELARVRQSLMRDPAGEWRSRPFKSEV
jgi:hypothetical protein